jgi:hypothetical protein
MKAAGYDVRENNRFAERKTAVATAPAAVPIVGRMQALWESMRAAVLDIFPPPPGLPRDTEGYLKSVEDIYRADAYHSLSIEGYSVSAALIEHVRAGNWDPDRHDDDRQSRDVLGARGYWQAFQVVKANVGDIIGGANAGALVRTAHRQWYRELAKPPEAGSAPRKANWPDRTHSRENRSHPGWAARR